jgi:hypothetical protein
MDTPRTNAELEDPINEKEIFANEIAGVGTIHGNIAITLASIRFDHAVGTPKPRRIVTARLILSNPAAGQLLQSLQRLAVQLEAAQKEAASQQT